MSYIARTTRISIMPSGEPLFSELTTHVTIEDEAAGEFLKVSQQLSGATDSDQTISIEPELWPILRDTIDTMIAEIAKRPTAL